MHDRRALSDEGARQIMNIRYFTYPLGANLLFSAIALPLLDLDGSGSLLLGHGCFIALLLSIISFTISAEAKQWRPLLIALGLIWLLLCVLGIVFLKELALVGAIVFFPVSFLGWLVGLIVERIMHYIGEKYAKYARKFLLCFLMLVVCTIFTSVGMIYYPIYFGKKLTLTINVPEGLSIDRVETYFESTDCEDESLPLCGDNRWLDRSIYAPVNYNEKTNEYRADAILENYNILCSWEPKMVLIYGSHNDAYRYDTIHYTDGGRQSIYIATLHISSNKNIPVINNGKILCRWYDTYSFTDRKVPHLECYNPEQTQFGNTFYLYEAAGSMPFELDVIMEEKPGGGFYHYTENPEYKATRP